jgi:hypothetical protein
MTATKALTVIAPCQGGTGVVGSGRKRMLRTQPIVDREYAGVGSLRQLAAERIVALEVATDEAAAFSPCTSFAQLDNASPITRECWTLSK